MLALQGVAVLVTRPERQAAPLCRLLEARGATAVPFAAIDIKPLGNRLEILSCIEPIEAFDVIVFTSANAVTFGAFLLSSMRASTLAAIGPATARALEQAGLHATVMPIDGVDSEHLLMHPQLQQPAGRRILLIKGRHGRELLRDQLLRRGARVVVAEVYERLPAHHPPENLAALEARFAVGAIHVITATSVEIVTSLLALATPLLFREFDRARWLVPSTRVARALRERGIQAPILQADSAADHDLVASLERWRSSVSGA